MYAAERVTMDMHAGADGPWDEDADLREHLAALGPGALSELRRVMEGSQAISAFPHSEFTSAAKEHLLRVLLATRTQGPPTEMFRMQWTTSHEASASDARG
jgi:hypothetical protein